MLPPMASDDDDDIRLPGTDAPPGDGEPRRRALITARPHRLGIPYLYADPVLPSPKDLMGYKEAVRQAPVVLLANFLAESEHRRKVEEEVVREELRRARRGQVFGLVVIGMGMLLGVALILAGHDWAGTALMGGNLVAMAALFVHANRGNAAAQQPGRGTGGV